MTIDSNDQYVFPVLLGSFIEHTFLQLVEQMEKKCYPDNWNILVSYIN